MSQLMNKILKEHCEQDNETYQLGVLTEKESRNTIVKHVRMYDGHALYILALANWEIIANICIIL